LLGGLQLAARLFNIQAGRFRGILRFTDAPFDIRAPLLHSSVIIQVFLVTRDALHRKSMGFQALQAPLVFLLQKIECTRFIRELTPQVARLDLQVTRSLYHLLERLVLRFDLGQFGPPLS